MKAVSRVTEECCHWRLIIKLLLHIIRWVTKGQLWQISNLILTRTSSTKRRSTLTCCKWSTKSFLKVETKKAKINNKFIVMEDVAVSVQCFAETTTRIINPSLQSQEKGNNLRKSRSVRLMIPRERILMNKRRQKKENKSMDSKHTCSQMNGWHTSWNSLKETSSPREFRYWDSTGLKSFISLFLTQIGKGKWMESGQLWHQVFKWESTALPFSIWVRVLDRCD